MNKMNMQNLMAQAQKIQNDIKKKKEELNSREFSSSNEWVDITMNGKKEIIKIKIKMDRTIEQDEIEVLEDMILIATKEVFSKIDKATEEALGEYGQLNGLI